MLIKGLLNFDSSCWNVDQRTFQLWPSLLPAKVKTWNLDFNWWVFCCSLTFLKCVIFICPFLIWTFYFYQENFDCCSSLKKIWSFKLEAWNLKLEIWNLEFGTWTFEIWNFEIEILKFCNLKFWTWDFEIEFWNFETWNLKDCKLGGWRFETWDLERFEILDWNLELEIWNFEIFATLDWKFWDLGFENLKPGNENLKTLYP